MHIIIIKNDYSYIIKYTMPRKKKEIKTNEINDLQKTVDNLIKRVKELEIKTKKVEDRKKPKKHRSAYLFFYLERLEDFKRKNPGIKIVAIDIAKESGKEWNKIKNDDKRIGKYKKLEEEDRKRVEKENIQNI